MFFFSLLSRLRLRISSRETGSAALSRVSPLTLHDHAESGAYSRYSSRFPRRRPPNISPTAIRSAPSFFELRNCVPMAFTGKVAIAHGSAEFCEATLIGLVDESKESLYGRETDRDLRSA